MARPGRADRLSLACLVFLASCASTDDAPDASTPWIIDAGRSDSIAPGYDASGAGGDGAGAAGCEGEPPLRRGGEDVLCGCTLAEATDFSTLQELTIQFTNKYLPRCVIVTEGAVVTWTGDFLAHPIWPSACSGDVDDNPIHDAASVDDTSVSIAFPSSGTFPYYCPYHASDGPSPAGMCGVVYVVP